MKCRWILTWKPIDPEDQAKHDNKSHKAKARLVVLGFHGSIIGSHPTRLPDIESPFSNASSTVDSVTPMVTQIVRH